MNFIRFALIAVLLCALQFTVYGQKWQWVNSLHSNEAVDEIYSTVTGSSIAVDKEGNSYVTGTFIGTFELENFTLTATNYRDIFIAKYSPSGKVLWAKQSIGYSDSGTSISLDDLGNCYITAYFQGPVVKFDHITLVSSTSSNMLVAKYDTNGNALWAKHIQGNNFLGNPSGNVAVTPGGEVYVIGQFKGSTSFGGTTLYSNDYDIFIAKYTTHGEQLWVKKHAGTGDDWIDQLKVDANGNSYILGHFFGTITFGANTITNTGSEPYDAQGFIAKFDKNGEVLWGKKAGGFHRSNGGDIDIDAAGDVYITGGFSNFTSFDAIKVGNGKLPDGTSGIYGFLAKYASGGEVKWVKSWGGEGPGWGKFINVDALTGNIYIAGSFWGKLEMGDWQVCATDVDLFVFKFDKDGQLKWVTTAGANDYEDPVEMALDSEGNCHIVGYYNETSQFGAFKFGTEVSTGTHSFVAKLEVEALVSATVATQALSSLVFCPGDAVQVGFDLISSNEARFCNDFTVQLSDAQGSFASPISIGSGASSPIEAIIPLLITAGTSYRIRVLSTLPFDNGSDNGADITIDAFPSAPQANSVTNCDPGEFILTASGAPAGYTYRWYSISSTSIELLYETSSNTFKTPFLKSTTTYYVSMVNLAGCESRLTKVNAVVIPAIQAEASVVTSICGDAGSVWMYAQQEITFKNTSKGAVSYKWDFGDGFTTTEFSPTHHYAAVGNYTVFLTAYSDSGCQKIQKVVDVKVENSKPIPNVITPNGDDKNQSFVLNFTCLPMHLKVYNRWGSLVFEQQEYNNQWNGGQLPVGIYYYQLSVKDSQIKSGWLTVKR